MGIMLDLVDFFTEDVDQYLKENEKVILSNTANLFQPISIGGMLSLTNERLIFFPHKLNLGLGDKEYVDLKDIATLKKVSTMQIVPNGLLVTLTNGTELQFVVGDRDLWIEKINNEKISNEN